MMSAKRCGSGLNVKGSTPEFCEASRYVNGEFWANWQLLGLKIGLPHAVSYKSLQLWHLAIWITVVVIEMHHTSVE